jgi:hypothetical protein
VFLRCVWSPSAARVLAVTLGLLASASFAANEPPAAVTCTPFFDQDNQLVIGHHALGTPKAALPTTLRKLDCGTAPSPEEEVCEHIDQHGFAYLVDNTSVTRIEARLGVLNKTGALPLGLRLGDSKKTVRKKIEQASRTQANKAWPISTLGSRKTFGQRSWATHYCVQNAEGALGSWYVKFDRYDRLVAVGVRLNAM